MLTTFEDVIVILACTLGALLFLRILDHFWPSSRRRDHNDIIGWQVSVLGTTYAVIMGFMLYAVWTSYQSAEINADAEANCLVSVFRLADGLPTAQRDQVHQLARVREYRDRRRVARDAQRAVGFSWSRHHTAFVDRHTGN